MYEGKKKQMKMNQPSSWIILFNFLCNITTAYSNIVYKSGNWWHTLSSSCKCFFIFFAISLVEVIKTYQKRYEIVFYNFHFLQFLLETNLSSSVLFVCFVASNVICSHFIKTYLVNTKLFIKVLLCKKHAFREVLVPQKILFTKKSVEQSTNKSV